MRFEGQVVLVTGGARGIGSACARAVARQGAAVAVADVDVAAAAAEANYLTGHGARALALGLDVADPATVEAAIDATIRWGGGLHALIHSAGVGLEKPFIDTTDEEWTRVIGIDLTGSFYVMRAAGRRMAASGYGRIVTLASTAGVRGGSGRAAYGAAKGGVIVLTKVLAVELAQRGVTVNALAPGAIETELVARMHSAATRENYRRSIPLDRYGTPEEVAEAAVFLASREAGYVSGQVLGVDGGFLAAGVLNK